MASACLCLCVCFLCVLREILKLLIFFDRQHLKEEICITANGMHGPGMKMLHAHEHMCIKK